MEVSWNQRLVLNLYPWCNFFWKVRVLFRMAYGYLENATYFKLWIHLRNAHFDVCTSYEIFTMKGFLWARRLQWLNMTAKTFLTKLTKFFDFRFVQRLDIKDFKVVSSKFLRYNLWTKDTNVILFIRIRYTDNLHINCTFVFLEYQAMKYSP